MHGIVLKAPRGVLKDEEQAFEILWWIKSSLC